MASVRRPILQELRQQREFQSPFLLPRLEGLASTLGFREIIEDLRCALCGRLPHLYLIELCNYLRYLILYAI